MATYSINLKDGSVEKPQMIIVGIDLGTTNSLVAVMREGQPYCVKGSDGKSALMPSILHFSQDGGLVVGEEARLKLVLDPAHTIYSPSNGSWENRTKT
jgi:molecular chaperone HscA